MFSGDVFTGKMFKALNNNGDNDDNDENQLHYNFASTKTQLKQKIH